MDFGLTLPTAGPYATVEAITLVAMEAERIGLDSLWTFERLLSPTEPVAMGDQRFPMPETYNTVYSPLEVLAFVAAKTARIRLGTSIISVLLHNPPALGRSLATLDQLSQGRIVAGLGQGWMREEFQAAGTAPDRVGEGFTEFIEAMHAVWGPDPVSHDGRFYTITSSMINPKPVQHGGPPIIVGATAPAAIRRAARLGLGFNPVLASWEGLEASIAVFRSAERQAGHEPGSLPVVVRVNNSLTDSPLDQRGPLEGSVEQVVEELPRLYALDVNEVFWSMEYTPIEPEIQIQRMERLLQQHGKLTDSR
jgi:probable F420-dependent oxidoreductase